VLHRGNVVSINMWPREYGCFGVVDVQPKVLNAGVVECRVYTHGFSSMLHPYSKIRSVPVENWPAYTFEPYLATTVPVVLGTTSYAEGSVPKQLTISPTYFSHPEQSIPNRKRKRTFGLVQRLLQGLLGKGRWAELSIVQELHTRRLRL
jgi:hypothetical protein